MVHVVILLAALAAVAVGQAPRPCEAPARFESRVLEVDPTKGFEVRARLSYDAINRRTRTIEEVNIKDKREFYDVLRIHDSGKEYVINMRTKKCETKKISHRWRAIEIPHNSTNYGEVYIGSSSEFGEGVLVTIWGGDLADGRYFGTWTNRGCLPVNDAFFSKQTGFVSTSFFDVTLGISDPDVFIPPKECV